jgi:acetoacetyl-CoA synthetase
MEASSTGFSRFTPVTLEFNLMSQLLWRPDAKRVARANLTRFIGELQSLEHRDITDYPSLYNWSIEKPAEFWPAVWDFCGVVASQPWQSVLEDGHKMPGARWFSGARLNFAENLLRYRDDREALVFWNEHGRQRSLTYAQLHEQVARAATALQASGVMVGDRVASFLPNIPETVVAMLATTSLGAVWSSTSPDFGLDGALDRFGQIAPKVLFAADGYQFNGKVFDSLERARQMVEQIPSIERTVVVGYMREDLELNGFRGAVTWNKFVAPSDQADANEGGHAWRHAPLGFAQLPFDHPVYILYSSGTTGVPKCIVHGAGGTLLQHLKELVLHTDLSRDDRILYFTTCGWMMWNWLISSLAVGATVILYDGAPLSPHAANLWDLAQAERLTIFGTSARYLAAIEKAGVAPTRTHDLSALLTILSTGSPLAPESFDYVYRDVKADVQLASISGGTDIVSCFALGNPIGPVYRGELQCRGLGMAVQVWNDEGQPVVGEKGELVCVAPLPSMPVYFWNDPGGEKYRDAYFDHYPGVWRHGDYVELTDTGGMIFYGRSDATLNPGGVRIGASEIYRQVEQCDEVLESLVIAQQWQGDERIVLFVKLRPGLALDDSLRDRICRRIRDHATPRHVPKKIIQVDDIPRTISGKIVELAVRNVIHGRPVKNRDALANPAALDLFVNLPELQT